MLKAMRLTDLHPTFAAETGRHGQGIIFDCPNNIGEESSRIMIPFKQPLDGGAPFVDRTVLWDRTGEDFETLTLAPSIQFTMPNVTAWHGFIKNGEITNA